jgi:hypothetical protein
LGLGDNMPGYCGESSGLWLKVCQAEQEECCALKVVISDDNFEPVVLWWH